MPPWDTFIHCFCGVRVNFFLTSLLPRRQEYIRYKNYSDTSSNSLIHLLQNCSIVNNRTENSTSTAVPVFVAPPCSERRYKKFWPEIISDYWFSKFMANSVNKSLLQPTKFQSQSGKFSIDRMYSVVPSNTATAVGLQEWSILEASRYTATPILFISLSKILKLLMHIYEKANVDEKEMFNDTIMWKVLEWKCLLFRTVLILCNRQVHHAPLRTNVEPWVMMLGVPFSFCHFVLQVNLRSDNWISTITKHLRWDGCNRNSNPHRRIKPSTHINNSFSHLFWIHPRVAR